MFVQRETRRPNGRSVRRDKMKTAAVLAALAMGSTALAQVTFNDAQNDLFDNGLAHIDIASVTVSHTATSITFDIAARGNLNATNWGKYCIGINTGAPGADTTNGWGRNVNWNGQGINFWVGTWADGVPGGEVRQMSGLNDNSNSLVAATYISTPGFSVVPSGFNQTITFDRSAIGMTGNGTFTFDVITTGSNADPGVDHLSRADQATSGWGTTSVAGTFLSYTIPAPSSAALLGLAALATGRRRR
jgi:uncharacterized protein (TIGR03382 family)